MNLEYINSAEMAFWREQRQGFIPRLVQFFVGRDKAFLEKVSKMQSLLQDYGQNSTTKFGKKYSCIFTGYLL